MPLSNFGVVDALGRLYRCAQPDASGLQTLETIGITQILSLNGSLDVGFRGNIWAETLPTFHVDVPKIEAIADLIEQKIRADGATVCVHCTHGRDRTGLVIGAWRIRVYGWSLEQVEAERDLYGSGDLLVELGTGAIERALRVIWERKQGVAA